jgi:hypothetical protein
LLLLGSFRPVILRRVAGIQGGRVALRGREDIQVEELPENTLGCLVVFDRRRIAVAVGIVVHLLLARLAGVLLLAALLATEQSAGEAAHGVLGLAHHLTGLIRGLSRNVLRLIGHPALGIFIPLLSAGETANGVLHLTHRLPGLVGYLIRGVLGLARHLLRAALLLVLRFAH